MRRTLGWLLLGSGIAGLGYWGHENQAKDIQSMISAQAASLSETARHSVTTTVLGRDITLEGTAHDADERDRLIAAASALPGRRTVHDNLALLPRAETYTFTATKGAEGFADVSGYLPDTAAQKQLSPLLGDAPSAGLSMASGAPNASWSTAVETGLSGLNALQIGTLTISGTKAALTGTIDTTPDLAALRETLARSPEGYDWDLDVEVARPDVEAYQLHAEKTLTGQSLDGYMPTSEARAALAAQMPGAGGNVALAANAPKGWEARVSPAIAALDHLKTGTVTITEEAVSITGIAATSADAEAFEAAAAQLGQNVSAQITVETPDPVAPNFTLTLDPISGLTVDGHVPAGLDAAAIAKIVGVAKSSGDTTAIEGADGTVFIDKLSAISEVVGDFERLNVSFSGDTMSVTGETLFDADPARLEAFLDEVKGGKDSVSISRSATVYEAGFERNNALTDTVERFSGRYWIPVFDAADITKAECAQRTDAALERAKIRFEPGSAEIDALSRQILNRLTGIIGACMRREPDTRILIGGHTDDVGTDAYNLDLSDQRAGNVLAALVDRGLPEGQLSAEGYGEARPVANNTTDEGRARNRRTTFEWLD